jgi:hypothetical protein
MYILRYKMYFVFRYITVNHIIDSGKAENRAAGRFSDAIFTTELLNLASGDIGLKTTEHNKCR